MQQLLKNRFLGSVSKPLSIQYTAYLIHSFVGLKLCLLFTVVAFSGALAVLSQEIDWLLYSQVRVEPLADRLDAGLLFDKLQAAYPHFGLSSFQSMLYHPNLASFAMFNDEQGGFRYAWIDPYTGNVQGDTAVLTVGRFIGFLHSTLYLPVIGRSLVNIFGVLTLISLVTGLYAYPKFWRYFLRLPRTASRRVFWSDLHKIIALWSLWFVLIIAVTGSWWFYKKPLVSHFDAPNPVPTFSAKPLLTYADIDSKNENILSAYGVTQSIKKEYPQARILAINPPEHNAEPYEVLLDSGAWLTSVGRQNKVYVNPLNGQIIGQSLVSDFTLSQRIDSAMAPLHIGTWAEGSRADLWVKIIWFLFGIGLTALAVTGLLIHLKRTARTSKILYTKLWRRRLVLCWRIIRPWGRPFGPFKYINILLIVGVGAGCGIALTLSSQGTKGAGVLYAEQTIGPWKVSMNAVAGLLEKDISPIKNNGNATFNVELSAAALKHIKFAYLNVGKPRHRRAPGYLVHGPLGAKHAQFRLPKVISPDDQVWLSIETWDGKFLQTHWLLEGVLAK